MICIPKLVKYKINICSLTAVKKTFVVFQYEFSSNDTHFLVVRKDVLIDMIIDGQLNDQYEIFLEEKDLGVTYWIYEDKLSALLNEMGNQNKQLSIKE